MSKTVILAEKPSVAVTIKNALSVYGNFKKEDGYFENDKYIVTFAFGHLFELWTIEDYLKKDKPYWSLDDLPFIPNEFKFKLKNDDGVKKQFNTIKKLVNRNDVDSIVNSCDSDREGEVIGGLAISHALESNKAIYRLWLPEQTEETIRENVKKMPLSSQYKNLYNEGFLRTIVDNLLGIQYSRYISLLAKRKLPVGRVLIPIVKAIYDRDMEIQNFKPQDFYSVKGVNEDKSLTISIFKTDKDLTIDKQKEQANNVIKNLFNEAEVISIEENEVTKKPKKLFSLDRLQNKMSKDYKLKPTDTLKALQKLYESGYTTYPRTNTEYLSENEKDKINSILEVLKSEHNVEMKDSKSIFDNSKIESHSAITITKKLPNINELNKNEQLVYEVIKNRFISNFLAEKTIITETKVILAVSDDLKVELKGKSIKQQGYLKYENDIKDTVLPCLSLGQKIKMNYSLESNKTKPKAHMTTEDLNNFLKNPFKSEFQNENDEYKDILEGIEIGTVATRGDIIENAINNKYIELVKDSYHITNIGVKLIQLLDILKIDLYKNRTIELSKTLKKVYKNEQSIEDGVKIVKEMLEKDIKKNIKVEAIQEEKEVIGKCIRCGKNIYEGTKNFYCEGYKDGCKFTIWKEDKFFVDRGKKITKSMAVKLLKDKVISVKGLKKKDGQGEYNAKVQMVDSPPYVNFKVLEFIK